MHPFWIALALGIVEGLTEFLPVSSTGHLIVTSWLLAFEGERAKLFEVFIQLGAILSVVWEYAARLREAAGGLRRRATSRRFALALAVAFVPAAALGFLLHGWIKAFLFGPRTVALALIAGALLILLVEALPLRARTLEAESVSWLQALGIGLAQCLSLWPGFSRAAATILGGLTAGLSRRAATEFSFFLAIPTMFAATLYDLLKSYQWLEPGDLLWLALASAVSFAVALVSIRWLLRYVSTHSLGVFAWYRLALGLVILAITGVR